MKILVWKKSKPEKTYFGEILWKNGKFQIVRTSVCANIFDDSETMDTNVRLSNALNKDDYYLADFEIK